MSENYVLSDARLAPAMPSHDGGYSRDGVVVVEHGKIAFAGPAKDLPAQFDGLPARSVKGCLVTPGLIDCHTHLVYAGSRAREFELRQTGASYEEIMIAGGGTGGHLCGAL